MKIIAALLFVLTVATASASEESHKAAVEKLFDTLQMKRQYETSLLNGFSIGASFATRSSPRCRLSSKTKSRLAWKKSGPGCWK